MSRVGGDRACLEGEALRGEADVVSGERDMRHQGKKFILNTFLCHYCCFIFGMLFLTSRYLHGIPLWSHEFPRPLELWSSRVLYISYGLQCPTY